MYKSLKEFCIFQINYKILFPLQTMQEERLNSIE